MKARSKTLSMFTDVSLPLNEAKLLLSACFSAAKKIGTSKHATEHHTIKSREYPF